MSQLDMFSAPQPKSARETVNDRIGPAEVNDRIGPAEPELNAQGEYVFPTVNRARQWIADNGWQPRHGGGYERGSERCVMVPRQDGDRLLTAVAIG